MNKIIPILLLLTMPCFAANHYVRQGASGTGSGADWTNACTDFTGSCAVASLVRGDTYYVAAGSYAGRTWNRAVSGTLVITIKKAIIADHGTDTGWSDAYAAQATFTQRNDIETGYWTFDGQVGDYGDGIGSYGFKDQYSVGGFANCGGSAGGTTGAAFLLCGPNITIKYFDCSGYLGTGDYEYPNQAKCIEAYGSTNWLVSHVAMHGCESCLQGGGNGFVLEYSYIYNSRAIGFYHNNIFYLSATNGGTVRYNTVWDYNAEGFFITGNDGPVSNVAIYGNVMWNNGTQSNFPRGVELRSDFSYNNIYIYNNTFYFMDGGILDQTTSSGDTCSACQAYNNLAINAGITLGSGFTGNNANNTDGSTTSIFVATTPLYSNNLHLTTSVGPGTTLSAPYNMDMDGNVRGATGVWDRGAFEYVTGVSLPTVTTTTATSITTATASSGGNVTADGGATVTGRGVCWATTANPTTADSCTSNGTGTGTYTSSLTGLAGGTLYHYRAFATNSVGTSYGSDLTFTTVALPNFALNDATSHPANPIGVNIGAPTYYDSYLLKNLIVVNPGLQSQQVRQIKTVANGSTTSIVTQGDYDPQPANYSVGYTGYIPCHGAQGASPGVCTGGAYGQSFTVTANTLNDNSSGTMTYTVTGLTTSVAANDTIWLFGPTNATTRSADFQNSNSWTIFGWQPAQSGSGSYSINTTNLPPTLNGFANANQCVQLSVTGSSDSASVLTYFDANGSTLNYVMSGNFHIGGKFIKLSGANGTVTATVQRSGGINASVPLTISNTSWADLSGTFTGSETTSTPPGSIMIRYTLTASSASSVCMVGATMTNDADTNPTAYRNQTVTNFQFLKPGMIRYNTTGQQGTSMLNWITPQPYRMTSGLQGPINDISILQQGLHEFLTFASYVGATGVSIVVPPTWNATEIQNFADYMEGSGATTYGGYRVALGQTTPWNQVFSRINYEMGNETWNSSLDGGKAGYPQYSVGPNPYWNYVVPAISACQTLVTGANWNSTKERCAASIQTSNSIGQIEYFTDTDTNHYVTLAATNEYMQYDNGNYPFGPSACGTDAAKWTPALVEPYGNTQSGAASGFYDANTQGLLNFVYEYQDHTLGGACNQTALNTFAPAQGFGVVNVLAALQANKAFGILDSTIWQYLQPQTDLIDRTNADYNLIWGIFAGSGGSVNKARPTAYAMAAVNGCMTSTPTRIDTTPSNVGTFNFSTSNGVNSVSNVPYLQEFAYKSGTQRCVIVGNIDQANPYSFTLSGTNTPTGSITQTVYTSASIGDNNEGANVSPVVTNATSTISPGTYTVPAHSLIALQWSTLAPPVITSVTVTGGTRTTGATVIR